MGRIVAGMTSNLERKSIEPIAVMHGVPRRGLQRFMGEQGWDYRPLAQLQRSEVSREIGVSDAAVIVDGSSTPKKGVETVGVKRQWCGRLGKVDNCVVGVYAVYVGAQDLSTIVASEIFLPKEWLEDKERREKAFIPEEVEYKSQAKLAIDMVGMLASEAMPFSWVLGDDEFGRSREFRDGVASHHKNYVLDVPSNTAVRRQTKQGHLRERRWSICKLRRRLHKDEWTQLIVRDGEKGPIEVRAVALPVATPRGGGRWVRETLLIIETVDETQRWYCLCHAPDGTLLAELVRRAGQRHKVEEVFGEAKGEVGLDHFEVRSLHGWHNHMTLGAMSHWFLVREKRRLGGKSPGVTVSQIRAAIAPLLAGPWTPERAADFINYHSERNYEAKSARYRALGLPPPPRG